MSRRAAAGRASRRRGTPRRGARPRTPQHRRGASSAPPRRIVLVGFMGSGKSAVGAALARLLGWRFVDMDERLEQRAGLTIARIFATQGEAAFREAEERLAHELADLERCVVAAGGGAFARPETRNALRAGALTVWLRCDLKTTLQRVPTDGTRPLAADRETITRLYAERQASYRLADLSVDASTAGPEGVARSIREILLSGRGTPER